MHDCIGGRVHACHVARGHGCMGAWVYGWTGKGAGLHGCMAARVHGCVAKGWAHGCNGTRVDGDGLMGAWVYACQGAWVPRYTGVWAHGCMGPGCMGARVIACHPPMPPCTNGGWVHGEIGACVHGPMGAQVVDSWSTSGTPFAGTVPISQEKKLFFALWRCPGIGIIAIVLQSLRQRPVWHRRTHTEACHRIG